MSTPLGPLPFVVVFTLACGGTPGRNIDGSIPVPAPDTRVGGGDRAGGGDEQAAPADGTARDIAAGPSVDAMPVADAASSDRSPDGAPDGRPADAPRDTGDAPTLPGIDGGLGGASRCADSDFLLCEDFESGAINGATWKSNVRPGAALEVTETRAARGRYALHVHSGVGVNSDATITERKTFSPGTNTFYGRAFVYLVTPLPKYNFNLFEAQGMLASGDQSMWGLGGRTEPFGSATGSRFVKWVNHPGGYSVSSATRVVTDRWVCWEFLLRGEANEARVWIDERELTDAVISGRANWIAPKFDRIEIGLHHAHAEDAPLDVWIDEIAIDDERIGCSR